MYAKKNVKFSKKGSLAVNKAMPNKTNKAILKLK